MAAETSFGVGNSFGLFHAKVFGERSGEVLGIASAVDFAFDLHRKNLITIVERFDDILFKIDHLDQHNHHVFHSVHEKIRQYAVDLPGYWEHNEGVLQELIQPWSLPLTYLILPSPSSEFQVRTESEGPEVTEDDSSSAAEISLEEKREVMSYDSLVQVIIHLNRDWSEIGTTVRKKLYQNTILPLLEKYSSPFCSSSTGKKRRVLVPGAGLGRLAMEIAAVGFDVEANESSGAMLCMMHALFNHLLRNKEQRSIYPFLHFPLQDDWDLEGRRSAASFPFIDDSPTLQQYVHNDNITTKNEPVNNKAITLQFGDFARIYSGHPEREASFDVVVTNFFIDTGCDIMAYISAIKHILVPGGIWVNSGPLHYHTLQAIPYSYHHLLEIIKLSGFEVLHSDRLEASYCGEDRFSMKPEVYNLAVSVFRRTDSSQGNSESRIDADFVPTSRPYHRPNYAIKR